MLKIGLTGGIGSGKTTVSDLFSSLGVPIIDTDIIAHEIVDNKKVLDEIINCFGKAILDHKRKLDRKALSQLVFDKQENKKQLETILHPKIRETVQKKILQLEASSSTPAYIIIVIPLLIETNFSQIIDRVLVVMSDEESRIHRIQQRDHRNMDEIHAIISTQASDQQRMSAADDIIKNNNTINELNTQIQSLHEQYLSMTARV